MLRKPPAPAPHPTPARLPALLAPPPPPCECDRQTNPGPPPPAAPRCSHRPGPASPNRCTPRRPRLRNAIPAPVAPTSPPPGHPGTCPVLPPPPATRAHPRQRQRRPRRPTANRAPGRDSSGPDSSRLPGAAHAVRSVRAAQRPALRGLHRDRNQPAPAPRAAAPTASAPWLRFPPAWQRVNASRSPPAATRADRCRPDVAPPGTPPSVRQTARSVRPRTFRCSRRAAPARHQRPFETPGRPARSAAFARNAPLPFARGRSIRTPPPAAARPRDRQTARRTAPGCAPSAPPSPDGTDRSRPASRRFGGCNPEAPGKTRRRPAGGATCAAPRRPCCTGRCPADRAPPTGPRSVWT